MSGLNAGPLQRRAGAIKRWLDFLIGVPSVFVLSVLCRSKKARPGEARKILVIKLAAAGDAILLVPVLRELRRDFPSAEIDWLISPVNAAIAETVPHVNRTILWRVTSAASTFAVIRWIRRAAYDVVIDFEQWARVTALMAFASGAAVRLGFQTNGQARSGLYTRTVRKRFQQHEIDDFYDLCGLLKPLEHSHELQLWETDKGRQELSQWAPDLRNQAQKRRIVVFQPGCGADGERREWPLESYRALGDWLLARYPAHLVLSGGPDEMGKALVLEKHFGVSCTNLAGRLTWQGSISLLMDADLLVSGNTGIMHVAAALGKRQVALHGPTDPALWGPLNGNAIVLRSPCPRCPCLRLGFEYHHMGTDCMAQIRMDTVQAAVSDLLESTPSASGAFH